MNKLNQVLWGMVKTAAYCSIVIGIIGVLMVFIVTPQWVKSIEIIVPNLIGKSYHQAVNSLRKEGLELERPIQVVNSSEPIGIVIQQFPLPNISVKQHHKIKVTLSSGSNYIPVPSVIGKSEDAAHETLVNAGFLPYSVAHVHSTTYLPDTVIAQNPAEGVQKNRKTVVNLLVSLGRKSQNIHLPDLQNQSVEEVLPALKAIGLNVEIKRTPHPRIKEGRIINHEKLVQSGAIVTLEVSGKSGDTENIGRWLTHKHTVTAGGHQAIKVKIVVSDDYRQRTVVDAWYSPGTVLELEKRRIKVFGKTLVIVYENDTKLYQRQYK